MKCLIIAAGRGSRLSTRGDSKPLISLLGLPLIERVILTANKTGLTDFYVITGHNSEKVGRHLDGFSQRRNIKTTHIINEQWEKGNGLSVLRAKELLDENFVLLMGDHIFDESILVKLRDGKAIDDGIVLAVDYNTETNGGIDGDGATKVLVENNMILDIQKDIRKYNAYDTGIFICSPAIFGALEESLLDGDSSLSGGIRVLAKKGKAGAFDIKNDCWVDVDDENTFKKAGSKLLAVLEKTSDGPVSRYLNRPISIVISKYLVRFNITPNFISLFSFILCCIGAIFFFFGREYLYLLLGATAAQAASIIDGCDGEIARLKFQGTEFGGWFDAVLDRYADAFLLFGLTYYVYSPSGDILYLLIGFLAIIGTFMNSYTADKYDALMTRKIVSGGRYLRMGRDIRILIIFLFAILNLPFLAILLIALLTNAENIRRVMLLYKAHQHGCC